MTEGRETAEARRMHSALAAVVAVVAVPIVAAAAED